MMGSVMGELVLHPRSKTQVAQYITAPSSATLIIGPSGIGKTYTAQAAAGEILGVDADKLGQYPYFKQISPDGNSISIDAIRDLQRFLQLKTVGSTKQLRRAVIIRHAHSLTTEAQNAFLKLLEEPPADTLLLLTASHKQALLPTILSRVQTITLYAPPESAVKPYFSANTNADASAINQAYFLSGGLPGLMHALLSTDSEHPLLNGVAQAKTILQSSLLERLAVAENLSKQKNQANYMLEALQRIAQTGLAQAATKSDRAKIKQWHHILKTTQSAQSALQHNANTKLVLTNLMLHL